MVKMNLHLFVVTIILGVKTFVVSAFGFLKKPSVFLSTRLFDIVDHRYDRLRNSRHLRLLSLHATNHNPQVDSSVGLYRKFSNHAWDRLKDSGLFLDSNIPIELETNSAPAKGMKDSMVQISVKAMIPNEQSMDLVRYARIALLETISSKSEEEESVQNSGIQVLNFVIIPSESTSLPVLGIDLVSLPGNRHLLLLDAQPMIHPNPYEEYWSQWYGQYVEGNEKFPWGGDFPEAVQKYVSKYSLWTRLQGVEEPVSIITNDVWTAFTTHLDIYLDLLQSSISNKVQGPNHQVAYLDYRRSNDPAKPMLNSLYGAEWTERVLDEVLFPKK